MTRATVPWDRRLAIVIAKGLVGTALTANAVTGLGLAMGLAGAALFAVGRPGWGGPLYMAALLMDHVDGELARLSGSASRFGHAFDRFASAANHVGIFIGMGLGLAGDGTRAEGIVQGIVAGSAVAAILCFVRLGERSAGGGMFKRPLVAGMEAEDIMYVVGPVAWLGWTPHFLQMAAVGAPLFLVVAAARLAWGKARRRPDPDR